MAKIYTPNDSFIQNHYPIFFKVFGTKKNTESGYQYFKRVLNDTKQRVEAKQKE